ncbi:hypothetical protein C8R45DRAFT_972506, partial [Mycena sanguinolenta]
QSPLFPSWFSHSTISLLMAPFSGCSHSLPKENSYTHWDPTIWCARESTYSYASVYILLHVYHAFDITVSSNVNIL